MISAERPPSQSQLFSSVVAGRIDPDHTVDNPMAVVLANRGHEPSPPVLGQDSQPAQSF
jgi:hypothetical protein